MQGSGKAEADRKFSKWKPRSKKLPRNEYSVLQPVRSTDKRVHSLPKTEKSGAVTQPNFYAKRVAANLFNATPIRR
jgi:hypothetical protein